MSADLLFIEPMTLAVYKGPVILITAKQAMPHNIKTPQYSKKELL